MELKRIFTVITMTILMFASPYFTGVSATATFGGCVAGKESCRDCYLTLKQELLKRDDNVFNLSRAFFPPETNPPEFVEVKYNFVDNGVTNETLTWYWVEKSSYFLFPPNTFQFLSLFFGKPYAYYTQKVIVTLNATDCLGVDEDHMTLLTQRLKVLIQRNSFYPILDNKYSAKSGRDLADISDKTTSTKDIINVIFCYQVFVLVLIIISTFPITYLSNNYNKWYSTRSEDIAKSSYNNKTKALLASVLVISALLTIYIVILDIIAIAKIKSVPMIISKKDLKNIPGMVLVWDFIIIIFFISCRAAKCYYDECNLKLIDYSLILLLICITISVNHFPFITIAYINDAYHAGSILIFYVFSILIFLFVTEVCFYNFFAEEFTSTKHNIHIEREGTSLVNNKADSMTSPNSKEDIELNNRSQTKKKPYFDFKQATNVSICMSSAELTLQFNKVKNGVLTDLCFQFNEADLNDFENNFEKPASGNLDVVVKLSINNKKISAKGRCEAGSVEMVTNELKIPKVELVDKIDSCGICIIICMIILCSFVLAGIVFTAAYLVVIPINRSISDAPNHLIGVYQTVLLLLGIYIGYKSFFKKEISLKTVVQKSKMSLSNNNDIDDEQWSKMSKEERLEEFYKTEAELVRLLAKTPKIT